MPHQAPEVEISSNSGDPSDIRNITGTIPLPSGASTLAEQLLQTAKLNSLDAKLNTLGQKTMAGSAPVVLASDQGTQQVPNLSAFAIPVRMIPYAPPTFVLMATGVALGNNKSMVSVLNTLANKILKIQSVKMINNQTSAVTGVVADFRFKRITGHSAGTNLTPQAYDLNDSLPVGITAITGSTVAGESTFDLARRLYSTDEWGTGTVDVEANDHIQQQLDYAWQNQSECKAIFLRQNQGLSIKCVTNTTVSKFDFEITFTVEDP